MMMCYRIVCITGRSPEPTNGSVIVTIDDHTAVAINIDFIYKVSFC